MCVCVCGEGGGGYTKNRLTSGLSRAPYARVWRRVRGSSPPQKKMNLGLAEIFHCRYGLEFETFSNVESQELFLPHPTLTISVQIWTNIFKKWKVRTPRPLPRGLSGSTHCQWCVITECFW